MQDFLSKKVESGKIFTLGLFWGFLGSGEFNFLKTWGINGYITAPNTFGQARGN